MYDFNGDEFLDCGDLNLLQAAARANTNNLIFDVNDDQQVNEADSVDWLNKMDAIYGDANLDHRVDHLDVNIVGINWLSTSSGFCQGDFSFDQSVTTADDDFFRQNWTYEDDHGANVTHIDLPSPIDAWRGNGVVFAETEHFELVSIPQSAPDELLSTILAVRAKAATNRIVTLRQLALTGDLHQVGLELPLGVVPTPNLRDFSEPVTLPFDWREADSHLLFGMDDIGAKFVSAMSEENDLTNPVGQNDNLSSFSFGRAVTGIGSISGFRQSDAFSLSTLTQSNEFFLAHLVTPAINSDTGQPGEVFVRVGILGANESNAALPDEGVVGFDENVRIPFFSIPCDFDANGRCDPVDLDLMLGSLGAINAAFDLQPDGTIDLHDRNSWLQIAGEEDNGTPFVVGDTDLNGIVDAADLNRLGRNWLSTDSSLLWSGGDFNADHVVDAADLNAIGVNWLHGSTEPSNAVPEPFPFVMLLTAVCGTTCLRRLQRSRAQ